MGSAPVLQIYFPYGYVLILFFFFNLKPGKFYLPWVTGKETKTGTVLGRVSRVLQRC